MPANLQQTIADIRSMKVRGAASIGIHAARALADHVQGLDGTPAQVLRQARVAARRLDAARPTAVTLHNCLGWVLAAVAAQASVPKQKKAARETARLVGMEVKASRAAIANHGAQHVPDGAVVLTHCHSSTALAVLAAAKRSGKSLEVIATETRPFRQGLITVKALRDEGISCALAVDSAVEHLLATRDIDLVLVGADTMTRDGVLINKIGTAGVAALAQLHEVPFYAAAGLHKFTRQMAADIPIEERAAGEVVAARDLARGARVLNPVFDRTPPGRIQACITEEGLASPRRAVQRNLARIVEEDAWG